VIAECTARRQVVELWRATRVPGVGEVDNGVHAGLGAAAQRLVRVYANRSDFPPEWLPEDWTHIDPLGHVAAGDLDPTSEIHEHCNAMCRYGAARFMRCTRPPHPAWSGHVAGDGEQVLAVWTDDPSYL